jgi:lipoprotein-anchoring transpeptidase ErfK/SrfK
MKHILSVLIAAGLLITLFPAPLAAAAQVPANDTEPYTGEVLCMPDVYVQHPGNCLPLGPSTSITEMARQGISYPPLPLAAASAGPEYNFVSHSYAKINLEAHEPAPMYANLEDAVARQNPTRYLPMGDGLRYITFIQRQDVEGKAYVMLPSGEWMRASPASVLSTFQGLIFRSNPRSSFGWIIKQATPVASPSFSAPASGRELQRETRVPIYQIVEAEGYQWYMIGVNQWVNRLELRQFVPNTTPPEGVTNNRWIEINLYEQTIAAYEDGQVVFATLGATGAEPYFTRPGLFQIYLKKETETMQGAFEADRSDYYHLADVPWTLYYDESRAIHGAYWRAAFGYEQSHGCVNLSIADSRWLFEWATEGDWVWVHDPSGRTPTDPSLYGSGGA